MFRSLLLAAVATLALAAPLGSQARTADGFYRWNGRIAFYDVTGIGSMNPDGSGQWGVELNVGDTQPAWSPDGTRLAVVTHWANNNGILVQQPDGSGAHMLTSDPNDSAPAWSPDGTQIAFTNGPDLMAVNADGSNRRTLYTLPNGWLGRPAWSPDGGWLAFTAQSWQDGTNVISELETGSGKVHTLISTVPFPQNPAFSPDGTQLAFASGGRIWVANADGTNPQQVTAGPDWDDLPAWSPNSEQIAFTRGSQIWVMDRRGGGAQQLTTGDGNSWPAWQPLGPPPSNCTLWGTSANDLLVGSEGNDILCGLDGNDVVLGLGGNDILRGDAGDDWLAGGTGLDFLDAGPGNDTLDGRDGGEADHLVGGPGVDSASYDGADRRDGVEHAKFDPNLAAWQPATASAFEPTNPPVRAVDGNLTDWWNSGSYPTQWLEVDLGSPVQIARVRFITMEYPAGGSILLLGRSTPDAPFHLLHAFRGPFADLEQLAFAPKKPWRNVRYLRLYIPQTNGQVGWVAWHELAVYAPTKKKH
jgi:RTX calcium-binding nonapeptide repeat (4 copies)/NedA-like, galactose-binding domain/WD40-like Beta Propeller Repeat